MEPMKKFMFEIKLEAFVILVINHHTKVLLSLAYYNIPSLGLKLSHQITFPNIVFFFAVCNALIQHITLKFIVASSHVCKSTLPTHCFSSPPAAKDCKPISQLRIDDESMKEARSFMPILGVFFPSPGHTIGQDDSSLCKCSESGFLLFLPTPSPQLHPHCLERDACRVWAAPHALRGLESWWSGELLCNCDSPASSTAPPVRPP